MAVKGSFLVSRYDASSVPNISAISGTTFGFGVAPSAVLDWNHLFTAVRTLILTISMYDFPTSCGVIYAAVAFSTRS